MRTQCGDGQDVCANRTLKRKDICRFVVRVCNTTTTFSSGADLSLCTLVAVILDRPHDDCLVVFSTRIKGM